MGKKKYTFREFLASQIESGKPVFFDGGMGTMIQKSGVVGYAIPEDLNFYHPEIIEDIHIQYMKAGCNVLTANSFGANPIKLEKSAHTAEEYVTKSIEIQKSAIAKAEAEGIDGPHFSSWDTGQIGKLLEPMGSLTFDQAYESYKTACVAAEKAGADLAIIETMSDLYEVKAAILAVRENTKLPIVATMTFQENLRTLTGADVLTCVTYLEALRPDVIGFNCGGSLEEGAELTRQFLRYAHLPVLVQPNAGLPQVVDGKTVFLVEGDEFAEAQAKNRKEGAVLLGGCCGTNPTHIRAMVERILKDESSATCGKSCGNSNGEGKEEIPLTDGVNATYVCSYNKSQQIGGSFGPVIIGERINPTGKKKCKEALTAGDMQFFINEAESQLSQGAHLLDVNVGLPGIDEADMMVRAVKTIQSTFNVPLQLDSSEAAVLERGLRNYNGKALVNSVNGKQEVMDKVFPIVQHYGGCLVALCIDEGGIAPTAMGRVAVAEKIIAEAAKYGIPVRDIFIDTLTLTVSSEQKTALETVRAIRMLKEKYGSQGLQFVLGVSNISFGLPRRDIMNSRFFMLALEAGLTGCIANPASAQMMDTFRAYRSLACYDENSLDYIQTYTGSVDPSSAKARQTILEEAVADGTISICLNTGSGSTSFKSAGLSAGGQSNQGSSQDSDQKKKPDGVKKKTGNNPLEDNLITIIEKGFKEKAASATEELLKSEAPVNVINNCIVPALDNVGKDFETGKKFLPQLLLSAETVGNSFGKIKETLAASGAEEESKGTIAIATVYGDIHDIGKNIVKAMLENYGYTVIDLGKNVPYQTVIDTVLQNKIKLLGLSALMTTTVANMEETIKLLHQALKDAGEECSVMVGGAVLTADYAEKIGADYYAKDAMESVAIAKEVFGK
ncbi:MAG: homocysteine S-methyltransferase family protein [Treponema sp.]|nr:homocysteine S-methyltransferase family protein [Treponema sp.]